MRRIAQGCALSVLVAASACSEPAPPRQMDTVLVDLSLNEVLPLSWIPGTRVAVTGDAFVDDPWGTSRLRLRGASDRGDRVDVVLPLSFASFDRLEGTVDPALIDGLGGPDARFDGTGIVEVISVVDGTTYTSDSLDLSVSVNDLLTPTLAGVQTGGIIFPNEAIEVDARDLLLPGEGETIAIFEGCFERAGTGACEPIDSAEVAMEVAPDRQGGTFAFAPRIAGIEPGHFEGTLALQNRHDTGNVTTSSTLALSYDMTEPILYGVSTDTATLGQYVDIAGAGFVGGGEGDTLLSFVGTFTPDRTMLPQDIDLVLTLEFVSGNLVRYIVSETDAIGQLIDVRLDTGVFEGFVTPTIAWQDQEVAGDTVPFSFSLQPVKQVVFVEFLPSYTESLRHFGLRAVDQKIRERIFTVLARDYVTLNVELRDTLPTDYFHFSRVEVAGPDPNGLGLLGYDNTPGKDTGNDRLYDRIGGVNALTQQDGFPGYGGIFIESLLGYSSDPAGFAEPIEPNEDFDAIFDPFRPERGGTPVVGADLAADVPTLSSGDSCPVATDRRLQLACAVWALGSMVGSTVSHEIGHSLGLADPFGPAFHNQGDEDNRLMDADRPFEERAEIRGKGPSAFCVDEYDYLRLILPTDEDYDPTARPVCF
ncbi:MAG: hypothetical protein AAF721_32020 [Myxococcota bacterium]